MAWRMRFSSDHVPTTSHAERISALWKHTPNNDNNNNNSNAVGLFLPSSFIWNHVIPTIVITFIAVSILYFMILRHFPTIFDFILYIYPPKVMEGHQNRNKDYSNSSSSEDRNGHPQHLHHHHETIDERPSATTTTPLLSASIFSPSERRKLCYQMTNFLINLGLSSLGLYYEYIHASSSSSSSSFQRNSIPVEATIRGYDAFVYISAAQIGYQLWSIPIGIYHIHESIPMIVHHITVILCASMSGFLRYGFRYYTPFFYGIVEISSIPLAIMNAFKDHPHTLQYYYPKTNSNIRYLFAALFLYIRIVLFIPKKYIFLRDHILLWTSIHQRYTNNTSTNTNGGMATMPPLSSRNDVTTILLYQSFMAIVSFSAFFLLLLQVYWATLIIKGIVKLFVRPSQRHPKPKIVVGNNTPDDNKKLQ